MGRYRELGFAKVDTDRLQRCGHAEVIYGEGKTPPQIIKIAKALRDEKQPVLISRVNPDDASKIRRALKGSTHHPHARMITWRIKPARPIPYFKVAVCAAGTVDIPVAEEAAVTLEFHGIQVGRIYDVGVAGIHRLLAQEPKLAKVQAVIVTAGMEGALPGVIAGLVKVPVIAVPVSSGYGTALRGRTALFAMLCSCATGMPVMNIDNGFGAAMSVIRIIRCIQDEI